MNTHALGLLDFEGVVRELKDCCASDIGRRALDSQKVLVDAERVTELVAATSAFKEILLSTADFPELVFPDIEPLMKPLSKIGAVLEPVELAGIAVFILSSLRLKKYVQKGVKNEMLLSCSRNIPELGDLGRDILSVIHEDGEMKDEKIPALRDLKKKILGLQKEVGRIVGSYMNDPNNKSYLQSDVPTVKDGRAVLPVKTTHKGKIKGVVHEISSTGATVFLEPFEVVELNNDIMKIENEYRRELLRILKDLTSKAAENVAGLESGMANVALLDTVYAKARYAIRHMCFPARYSKTELILKNARHPLIPEKKVVPLSLALGEDFRVLIVTGPNTGGKTVCLKTTGLCILMNQFGMEIPADEGTTLPVVDDVFADIGDEQSLEQSLSTFSGHMVNIARIVNESTRSSLVLLDELGAGTDPEEGVAIAMSLLDHFIEKGSIVLTTTHHGILKNYGYTREYVENASMEFDTETLTPQYRLLMGVPGSSYAIIVAEKNGLPGAIVTKAKSYLEDERTDISELIKKLSEKHRDLIHAEQKQKIIESELSERERKTDLKELRLRQKEYELRSFHLKEIKEFLSESRKKLEGLTRELKEGDVTKEKLAAIRGFVGSISERVNDEEETIGRQYEELVSDSKIELKEGMSVLVRGTGMKGKILRKGKAGSWIVLTDTLKVSLRPDEISPAGEDTSYKAEVVSSVHHAASDASYQIDVRGLRLDEALKRVEKQLDAAVMAGLTEFSVVHGMGDGILQKGIHQYLRTQNLVKDFYFSMPEHGGFGRTIIVLAAK